MAEDNEPKKIPLRFYRSAAGSEMVRDWLNSLPPDECKAVGRDLMLVQYGWPVGMPLCRPLGQGLWEVRSDLPSDRIARVLFCFHAGALFALHGFIKKTRKTPEAELALARKRQKEVQQ